MDEYDDIDVELYLASIGGESPMGLHGKCLAYEAGELDDEDGSFGSRRGPWSLRGFSTRSPWPLFPTRCRLGAGIAPGKAVPTVTSDVNPPPAGVNCAKIPP